VLNGTQTAAGNVEIDIIKRTAGNTGGTAVADTAVNFDSATDTATAGVIHYTANPSGLGSGTTILSRRCLVPAPTTAVNPATILEIDYRVALNGMAPVLRGTSEILAINLGGATPSGAASFVVSVEWTEETASG
jgi:hypothetical protein